MPTVKRWADDLRAAFGAAEFDASLRGQGYYAREGGRTVDTRKEKLSVGVTADAMVIGPQAQAVEKVSRGR